MWSDPRFRAAVAALAPQAIRVFGGTTANYWDWRAGTFVRGPHVPAALARARPHVHVTLADWAALARTSRALPVFDLNLVTSTLASQLAMLRAARRVGMPVRLVELGNELYGTRYRGRFPSGAAYGRVATRWAAALHAAFPGVQVAAVADPGGDVNLASAPGAAAAWNAGLARNLHGAQALTLHLYFASGLARRERPAAGGPVTRLLAAGAGVVAAMRSHIDRSRLATWVTEWNLFDRVAPVQETWAQGLAVAAVGIDLLADPRVTQIDNHALVASAPFGALFASTDGLRNADPQFARVGDPPATKLYGRSADGVAMGALLAALRGAPGGRLAPVTFAGGEGLIVAAAGRVRAVLVNVSEHSLAVALPAALVGLSVRALRGDPATLVAGTSSLDSSGGRSGGTLTLPAYSLTLVGAP
jgi:hypothetical protein